MSMSKKGYATRLAASFRRQGHGGDGGIAGTRGTKIAAHDLDGGHVRAPEGSRAAPDQTGAYVGHAFAAPALLHGHATDGDVRLPGTRLGRSSPPLQRLAHPGLELPHFRRTRGDADPDGARVLETGKCSEASEPHGEARHARRRLPEGQPHLA